jgi:hypothetical protein
MLLSVAVAAAGLLLAQAVIVAALAALRPRQNIYVTIVLVAVVTAPAVFFADRLLFGRPLTIEGRLFLVLMHLTLGGFFFHFMTLPDRSVTLRMLVELERAPGQTLSLPALASLYSVRTMIASRLDQLADGQFIALDQDGTLTLKPRGEWFGRFVTGGRRLFRITSAN